MAIFFIRTFTMSTQEIVDAAVRFIIENSEFLTDQHIQALDNLWSKMQNTFPTLPPSPKEVVPPKTPESEEYYEEQESFKNIVVSSKGGALSTADDWEEFIAYPKTLNTVVPVPPKTHTCPYTLGLVPHTLVPFQSVGLMSPKPRTNYNHHNWPSPLPKVFVQHIRGRNAWTNYKYWRRYDGVWSKDFKDNWLLAGNTEFRLTHENCLRFLAYRCNCSVEDFLLKKPVDVNLKLFSPYTGIKGHFMRHNYY
jgi:hypothetical protein